jgi:O-antigen ligase
MVLRGNDTGFAVVTIGTIVISSLIAFVFPQVEILLLPVILLLTAWLSWRSLGLGVSILVSELLIGSKGHLLAMQLGSMTLPLRIGLVAVVTIIWLIRLYQKKVSLGLSKQERWSLGLFLLYLTVAALRGWLSFAPSAVFLDANGWGALVLVPLVLSVIATQADKKLIWRTAVVGTLWMSTFTLVLLMGFANGLLVINGSIYAWLRQTGLAEVTAIADGNVRIFLQSQIYCVLGLCVGIGLLLHRQIKRVDWRTAGYVYLMTFALLISQSRSFWLGALASIGVVLCLALMSRTVTIRRGAMFVVGVGVVIASQVVLLGPLTGNWPGNVFGDRLSGLEQEPAASTRLAQLQPLGQAIAQQPIVGFGFGKALTYISDDPRVRQNNPSGAFTTTAFEWGYLDITLKLGLIGLALYAWWVSTLVRPAISLFYLLPKNPLLIGGLSALVGLLVTNAFSPYLNHPLGFGFLALVVLAIRETELANYASVEPTKST